MAPDERPTPKAWTIPSVAGFLKSQFHRAERPKGIDRLIARILPCPSRGVVFTGVEGKREPSVEKQRKRAPPLHIDRSRLLNMAPGVAFAIGLILVVGQLKEGPSTLAKTFTFPEYPYKETTKNVSRPKRSSRICSWYAFPTLVQVMVERGLVLGVALFTIPALPGTRFYVEIPERICGDRTKKRKKKNKNIRKYLVPLSMFSIFEEVRKKKLSSSFLFFLSSGSMLRMLNCSILYEWDSCIGFYELEFSRDLCDIPSVMRDTREGLLRVGPTFPWGT